MVLLYCDNSNKYNYMEDFKIDVIRPASMTRRAALINAANKSEDLEVVQTALTAAISNGHCHAVIQKRVDSKLLAYLEDLGYTISGQGLTTTIINF